MAKYVVAIEWDDVPHLSEKVKADLYKSYLPHERDARKKGIPAIGAGKIYPIPEDDILVHPFVIPPDWPRVYALDVGWRKTACIWAAIDPIRDIVYLYDEYHATKEQPYVHTYAIMARGKWIPGVVDPASDKSNVKDGTKLYGEYQKLGLKLRKADNAVEAGIMKVLLRLAGGRLKVFSTLQGWLSEYRVYSRDKYGKPEKHQEDDYMDATKYLVASGIQIAAVPPDDFDVQKDSQRSSAKKNMKRQSRDSITGC